MKVSANAEHLVIKVKSDAKPLEIVCLPPSGKDTDVASSPIVAHVGAQKIETISLPRFDGERDRLYYGFAARTAENPALVFGNIHDVEELNGISANTDPFPIAASKKGLQVQMVEDAIALGVKHAALNVSLTGLMVPGGTPDSIAWQTNGKTFHFSRRAIEAIPVKELSDAKIQVTLILLNHLNSDAKLAQKFRPPNAKEDAPNKIYAFNVSNEENAEYLQACAEFLADRFSGNHPENGCVVGYIVGNEVNSHWHWYNMGRVSLSELADQYLRAVRIIHTAVRKSSASARVYISLDHFWSRAHEKDDQRTVPGRALIDELNRLSKLSGDFDWHIAFHPYPENLFEPRFWRDKTALRSFDSPRITFKNLEQLPLYLQRQEQLINGEARHVILSEQGFHTLDGADGETIQAAAYAAAYYKVAHLDGIDAFILHRHVDHQHEREFKVGLWTRKADSIATPDRKKQIYEVFQRADTPEWEKSFEFALPILGVKKWEELLPEKHDK